MDILTDRTHLSGLQTVKNEQNTDGMAWRAKKFRTMALMCSQFFNNLRIIINFFNDTDVKGSL